MLIVRYINLELGTWTAEAGLSINDPVADNYRIVQENEALSLVMCSSKPYSGWLAKHVEPLYFPATSILFEYQMLIDDATTACAQVAETDTKLTDADGWTYDLSAQWNIANNWMFQIDDENWTWMDTGIRIPPPIAYTPDSFSIEYAISYQHRKSAIIALMVGTQNYEIPEPLWIPARQEHWKPNEIVTQLQQVNNSQPGGYTLRFSNIEYSMEQE